MSTVLEGYVCIVCVCVGARVHWKIERSQHRLWPLKLSYKNRTDLDKTPIIAHAFSQKTDNLCSKMNRVAKHCIANIYLYIVAFSSTRIFCRMVGYCKKYQEFDPMLESPLPSNPWITGDTTLWSMEMSL